MRAVSSSVPPSQSPYAARGPGGTGALPWYRVLVRVVLVVVPGQIVGALLATVLSVVVGVLAHPGATALFWVVPGLVAGIGVGLLLLGGRDLLWGPLGLAALVGALAYFLLVALGQTRADGGATLLTPRLLGALVGCVVVQTVVGAGIALLRRRTAGSRR